MSHGETRAPPPEEDRPGAEAGKEFDTQAEKNNYINNYKLWKACFPDRKPVTNATKTSPR